MASHTSQDKKIAALIHHDIHIQLDATIYGAHLTPYECMLLNLLAVSRQCAKAGLYDPTIVVFDYGNKIICNKKFNIELQESHIQTTDRTNFRLELAKVTGYGHMYFMLQEKEGPDKVVFHGLDYPTPIEDCTFTDYSRIVNKIVAVQQLHKSHETLDFDIVLHRIDFETGQWHIKKP